MPIGWESVLGVDWKHRYEWGWKLIKMSVGGCLLRLICGVIRRTDIGDVHFDALSDVEMTGVRQTPLIFFRRPRGRDFGGFLLREVDLVFGLSSRG